MATLTQTTVTDLTYEEVGKWALVSSKNEEDKDEEFYLLPKRVFRRLMKKEQPIDAVLAWTLRLPGFVKTPHSVIYMTDGELEDYKNSPGYEYDPTAYEQRDSWEVVVEKLRAGHMENFVSYHVGNDGFCYSPETKRPILRRLYVNYCWSSNFLGFCPETKAALDAIPQIVEVTENTPYYNPYGYDVLFDIPEEEFQEVIEQARKEDKEFWSCRVSEIVFEKYTKHLWVEKKDDEDDDY